MIKNTSLILEVASREGNYKFATIPIGTSLPRDAGVYIFVFYNECENVWRIVYIGQTSNFRTRVYKRLTSHHKWERIKSYGATHVGLLNIEDKQARVSVEQELIRSQPTCCNIQHNYFNIQPFIVLVNLAALFGVEYVN